MKPKSSSRRYVGVILLSGLLLATFLTWRSSPPEGLSFNPKPGDSRDYRVDLHMLITAEGASPSHHENVVSLQSLLRYSVDSLWSQNIHVQPLFMSVSDGYDVMTSAGRGPFGRSSIKELMSAGFNLTMDDSQTMIKAVNEETWRGLLEQTGEELEAQMRQQIMVPAVTSAIPMQQDAEVHVQGFQGMPPLNLRVEAVDDDGITVDLVSEAGAPALAVAVGSDEVRTQIMDVKGRMRLSRDGGWVESMVLLSSQKVEAHGRRANVRVVLSVHHVDSAASVPVELSLKRGLGLARLIANTKGLEMNLPQTASEQQQLPVLEPVAAPFANPEGQLSVDKEAGRVELQLNLDMQPNEDFGQIIGVETLELFNAEGEVLDIPLVLEEIGTGGLHGADFVIRFLAAGWEKPDLEKIAKAEAVLQYRAPANPTKVSLPLADTATDIHEGNAQARAIPTEGGWRVILKSTGHDYYLLDRSDTFPGLSAQLASSPFEGTTAIERGMLGRVTTTDAWETNYTVQGEGDRFKLLLVKGAPVIETSPLSFISEQE
ncbi:hypothetical protein [Marinobacterium lutimaris]|uniref:Uncharacterized protein n=1 Tax=Marinobacterium lutimaris TaxID=568106 RepID=A0A1H5TWI7_9GAMM|nr:hypothetical protein [Marinobacterium lutimaris]SEF67232.1 hypothetical protein SAMN05444390_101193 [Marinobacterium lutimaris]